MRNWIAALLWLLFFFPVALPAQTDNTVYVKNFSGSTVGEMTTAAQAACNPSLTCIVVFDPSLASYSQGTLPAPCGTCIWEDYRVPGTLNITGNVYVNGTQIGESSGAGGGGIGGSGGNGTLTAPTLSPSAGTYTSAQSVTIGLPYGATGCYTVDGSTPMAASGVCTHGSAYSSPVTVATSETVSALTTESGWSNSPVTSATYTINSSGSSNYSDSFAGANGSLGPNWARAFGSDAGLQLFNGQVYADSAPAEHAFDIYTGGSFSNNQWTSFVLGNGPGGSPSAQGAIVRGSTTTANWYNDAVSVGGTFMNLGNGAYYDFCLIAGVATYAGGDTHELDVAGTGPVFFWSKHNGVVDATCVDTGFDYTGGQPGLGVLETNSTPTVSAANWQGGSLPDFNTTPTDNFTRANAGWLGVNWWFKEPGGAGSSAGAFFILQNNAAVISRPNNFGIGIWTTPFNANHSSSITLGNLASGDYAGPVVRYSLPVAQNPTSDTFYMIFGSTGGLTLLAYNKGAWAALQNFGTYPGTINTMELDATGNNPVVLTLKVNGSQFGSSYSDSTYRFTGSYAGFGIVAAATQNTTVTGWTGANL